MAADLRRFPWVGSKGCLNLLRFAMGEIGRNRGTTGTIRGKKRSMAGQRDRGPNRDRFTFDDGTMPINVFTSEPLLERFGRMHVTGAKAQ